MREINKHMRALGETEQKIRRDTKPAAFRLMQGIKKELNIKEKTQAVFQMVNFCANMLSARVRKVRPH